MDILSDSTTSNSSNVGFFEHMSNFDDQTKSELLNMLQYTLLLIIPVILLDKAIGDLFTHDTEDKHTFELVFEVVTEVVLLIIGMYLSHRLVSYIPTYSGQSYKAVNFTSVLLVFIFIVTMFQTSLREKVDALLERVYFYISGFLGIEAFANNGGGNSNVKSNSNSSNSNSSNSSNSNSQQMNNNQNEAMTKMNTTPVTQLPSHNNANMNVTNEPFMNNMNNTEPQPANSVLGGSLF